MSKNYANPIPIDQGGNPMQEYPAPDLALSIFSSENAVASSVITLTDNTTVLEIAAQGGPAVIKWIATTDTAASVISGAVGANYDHVIPKDTYRRFVVPQENQGTTSIVGLNKQAGLYNRVAVKSFAISSVATIQF